jgi:hypothetical protein
MRPVSSLLDPLAHKAAIDAMEAQRAAYRRFARLVETQQQSLNHGDADRAATVADEVTLGSAELEAGARELAPLVAHARGAAGEGQREEIQRTIEALAHDAQKAEQAIRNLSSQLEAWRDATGRQLSELGIVPDGANDGTPSPDTPRGRYGAPNANAPVPRILDRRG